jgi:hypothetical protein
MCWAVLILTSAIYARGADRGIAGTWRFDKQVETLDDGSAVPGSGGSFQGLLVFTAGGRFIGTVVPRGRQWRTDTVAPDELRRSLSDTSAVYGTYRLDAQTKKLTLHFEGSLDPSTEGNDPTEGYKITGDTLVLSGSYESEGTKKHFEVTWTRLE